jgi:hypothetical protein
MHAHAHADRSAAKDFLRSLGTRDGIRGAREGEEEGIALCVHLEAAMACKCLPKEAPMLGEHVRVAIPELK